MQIEGVGTNYHKPVEPEKPKPNPIVEPQTQQIPANTVRYSENQYAASVTRVGLDRKLQSSGNLTPTQALDEINRLPKPDVTSPRAVADYKQQVKTIADSTIQNAKPPQFSDFLKGGLNGRTAEYEYDQAKSFYDQQINRLKAYSDEATRNPNKILSPYEAQQKIDRLPPPDRSNPDSIRDYNDKRAQIANDALLYAKPPTIEDFRSAGLNGRTAEYEYEQAKQYYDSSVKKLKEYSAQAGSTSLLTPEAESAATAKADELSDYINDNRFEDEKIGKKIASEIENLKAQYGDEAAAKMMSELYKKNEDLFNVLTHVDHLSDGEKQSIGKALGDGYGYLSAEDKAKFAESAALHTLGDSFTTNVNFGKSTTLAELLKFSGNSQMKTDVVNAMMSEAAKIKPGRLGDNGGVDVQALFKSAAMLADSASGTDRAAMLKSIVETLPKVNLPSLSKDNETKDLLSKLFMNAGEDFMHMVAPDGAINSSDTRDGMIKLFELTMFSEGNNSERDNMMAYMVKLTQNVGDAAVQPPIPQSEYEKTHGGWSQDDHVEAMSTMMATVWKAADNQKEAIKADREQQKKTTEMFTGLAFSFIPGAGKVLGELGGEGADYLEQIAGKVRDFAWDKAKGALENGVNGQFEKLMSDDSLENIDTMLGSLRNTVLSINASLPNGEQGELDLRTKFQSAFAFYQLV